MNVRLRLAKTGDAARIASMSRELIEHGLPWSWTPARVLGSIRAPDTVVLVAHRGARMLGFAIMFFGVDEAHLSLFAVARSEQRRGLGRRMLEWLERSALVAGVGVVNVEARAGNDAARRFYQRLGFQQIRRLRGYYCGKEDAIRLSRDLHQFSEARLMEARGWQAALWKWPS